ncbi:MAG: WCX domain-containing protein [Thermoleophilia bacterium]
MFTTPYADREALVSWVLSLGRRAELLAPPDLRAYVRSRLDVVEAAHRA